MNKNFTKLIILCLIAGFSFSACKKSSNNKTSDDSSAAMKLTLNGKAVSYKNCLAADISANGIKQFNIIGENQGDESLAIGVIADLKTVKAGQVFNAATDYVQENSMTLFYTLDDTHEYTSQILAPSGSVTITSVTATTIKGTFSGKLYEFSDTDATSLKYTITDGTFSAQLPK